MKEFTFQLNPTNQKGCLLSRINFSCCPRFPVISESYSGRQVFLSLTSRHKSAILLHSKKKNADYCSRNRSTTFFFRLFTYSDDTAQQPNHEHRNTKKIHDSQKRNQAKQGEKRTQNSPNDSSHKQNPPARFIM